ncbi:hypothetical protein LBMAG42_14230 [Deltaproteobacteria bacterium]|nr:hypothetical protein LBMAG42_14230 [Deltaproteobacteria bacterium]
MKKLLNALLVALGASALGTAAAVTLVDRAHPMFNDLPWIGAAIAAFGAAQLPWARRGRARMVAAAASLLAAPIWMLSVGDSLGPLPARMVIFGVDGATWDVIDAEPLPAFHAMSVEGARGDLISMEPMFSPLLWTTIASGRPVSEHGVRGFHVHSDDCKVARWWDIAEASGDGVGLYKWLVDYPPRTFAHGGFWVPSWLAPTPETWPARLSAVKEVELANRLRRKAVGERGASLALAERLVDVGVRLSTLSRAAAWTVEERLTHPDEPRRNTAMQLIRGDIDRDVFIAQLYAEAPAVASLNYYATDGLAHLYWDRYAAGGGELRAAYRQADEILGELRRRLGPKGRILVVSDHGFKAMDGSGTAGQFLPLTERLSARISAEVVPVDVTRIGHKLVVGTPSPADAERVRAWASTFTDSAGKPFYKTGDFPDDPGSVALTLADEQITADRMKIERVGGDPLSDYVTLTATYTGTHEQRGVILAWGAGVTPGRLGAVPLLDAAPTLLAGGGLPAAEDMSGRARVWPELPRVATWDGLVPGLRFLGADDEGVNEDMLKALGYVDDGKPSPKP